VRSAYNRKEISNAALAPALIASLQNSVAHQAGAFGVAARLIRLEFCLHGTGFYHAKCETLSSDR
jgi:hypothetical protein